MAFEAKILDERDTGLLEEFYIHYSSQTRLSMNLKLDFTPDIREALTVLGHDTQFLAIVEKQKNHIACACAISLKKCYIQGSLYTIGYMSSMKAREEYRGSLAFALFMKLFNTYWKENKAIFWFFSVFASNELLNRLMVKKHLLFPEVEVLSGYHTHIFKPAALGFHRDREDPIQVRFAVPSDLEQIERYLATQYKEREFLPCYSRKELEEGSGLLKDLSLNLLALAIKDEHIVGMAALWDQSQYRRWFVERYSIGYQLLRPLINTGALLTNRPSLPGAGKVIPYQLISLLLIEGDRPEIFRSLYQKLIEKIPMNSLVSVGLVDQHPLNKLFEKKCISMHNNLYIAYQKENTALIRSIKKNKIYIEQGGL